MSDIEFIYIGWCNKTKNGVKSDKVWTAIKVGSKHYACWGARGKALRFKQHNYLWDLIEVKKKKEKEYNEVEAFELFTIFPYFKEDVAKKLTFDIMSNKVMPA